MTTGLLISVVSCLSGDGSFLFIYIGCLNTHGSHMTTTNSTNDNVVFFFVSDLKIVYYNNY